jgi:hypothetical protein
MTNWTSRIAPLVALTVMSCSVVETTPINSLSPVSDDSVSYFLPIGRVHLVVDHMKSGTTTITVAEVIVPDATQAYKARLTNNPLSRDNIKVTLQNGMLQQITSTTEDQTGVVAKNLAKTAKQVIQLAALAAGGAEDVRDFRVDVVFDPFDPQAVTDINNVLRLIGGSLSPLTCVSGGHGVVTDEQAGLLYRPALPYILKLAFSGPPAGTELINGRVPAPAGINSFAVNLPSQCSPILSLEVDRTAFGRNVTTINFANGSLADFNVDKESEVAGFSQIPVDVTAELLTLPQDLLTLRYNNVSAQDKLVAEQSKLFDDQAKLIESMKKFADAKASAVPTQTPVPPAAPSNADVTPIQTH